MFQHALHLNMTHRTIPEIVLECLVYYYQVLIEHSWHLCSYKFLNQFHFVKSDAADYLRLRAIDDYFEVCDWSDQDKLPPKSIRTEFTVQVNKLGNVSFTSSSTSREKTKSPSPVGEHSFHHNSLLSNENYCLKLKRNKH